MDQLEYDDIAALQSEEVVFIPTSIESYEEENEEIEEDNEEQEIASVTLANLLSSLENVVGDGEMERDSLETGILFSQNEEERETVMESSVVENQEAVSPNKGANVIPSSVTKRRSKSATKKAKEAKRERESVANANTANLFGNMEKRFKLKHLVETAEATLSTEEKLVQRLNDEKEKKRKEIAKRKQFYEKLKNNGIHPTSSCFLSDQEEEEGRSENKKKVLTIPKSPTFLSDKRLGKKEIKGEKKRSSSVCAFASSAGSAAFVQDSKPLSLTVAQPFSFETEKRILIHHMNHSQSNGNLEEEEKACLRQKKNSFTASELMTKFFQQELRHYESNSNKEENEAGASSSTGVKELTKPVSPVLLTKRRAFSSSNSSGMILPLSKEEIEATEMEEIAKHPFKARPINKRILYESHGEYGVPKVPVKPCTIPVEISLRTDKRATSPRLSRPSMSTDNEDRAVFKALPLPSFTAERLPTPPSKKYFQPTVPISPKFHPISERENSFTRNDEFKELRKDRASSAPARRQKPHHSIVEAQKKADNEAWKHQSSRDNQVTNGRKEVTIPKEFHLESDLRGEFRKLQFQEQLMKEEEENAKKREVKALPLPSFSSLSHSQPVVIVSKPLTETQPFHLLSVDRHEASMEAFHLQMMHDIENKMMEEEKHKNFKAKPLPKSTYEPETIVVPSTGKGDEENHHPNMIKSVEIILESDKRAEKRRQFDEMCKKQQFNQELLQQQLLQEKELNKQRELALLRRKSMEEGGLMFKAKPVLSQDPFPLKRKRLPLRQTLTTPKSPNLQYDERRKAKQLQQTQQPHHTSVLASSMGSLSSRV
jgi:hypothetical protein